MKSDKQKEMGSSMADLLRLGLKQEFGRRKPSLDELVAQLNTRAYIVNDQRVLIIVDQLSSLHELHS